MKGESLRDKRRGFEEERGKVWIFRKAKKNQRGKERRFLRENSKKREKGVVLSLEILDFLKKRR